MTQHARNIVIVVFVLAILVLIATWEIFKWIELYREERLKAMMDTELGPLRIPLPGFGVTRWQEHKSGTIRFLCTCGQELAFGPQNYFPAIAAGAAFFPAEPYGEFGKPTPEIPARHSVVCDCGLGHFKAVR